ncbi:MAG: hypothetical protein C4521_10180 [Actinobacteria bacterium]|nr:MAG: hypothetical protein C4521_10180 [Actinomycetota bacterium]
MRGARFAYILLGFLLAAALAVAGCPGRQTGRVQEADPSRHIRTPHFLDSFPLHEDEFAQAPELVKINFDFDLADRSNIRVTKDGRDVTGGETSIAPNNLSMQAPVEDAGDGTYLVRYTAYWPDGTNHDGQFSFSVDEARTSEYEDLTGRPEVTVDMQQIRFAPRLMIVDRGTRVTWTNRESTTHFVNTDPHASHNVLPRLNSRGLQRGDSYSYVFNEVGEWGYHCSAHFPQMKARVIVREAGAARPETSPGVEPREAEPERRPGREETPGGPTTAPGY